MLLLFDIGNTTISAALVQGQKVLRRGQILSRQKEGVIRRELARLLRQLVKKNSTLNAVIVTSVVPDVTRVVARVVRDVLKKDVLLIGRDLIVPIKNLYRQPKQVGQDRLVCAYAAKEIYGAPAIVLDLGTAITVDVISAKGAYLGGMIIPGLRLSAESLFQKTALLPLAKIKRPTGLIGKNTQDSILSGLFYGYGAMMRGVVEEISVHVKASPAVVMTGGYAEVMKSFLKIKKPAVDRDLIFKGMVLLWGSELPRL